MGEVEKYLESREPKAGAEVGTIQGDNYSIQERFREAKMKIEMEWNQHKINEYHLRGKTLDDSDLEKIIYYLVKKGIL